MEHYLQYQPKKLNNYVKKFDFQCSDTKDDETILLINMLVDARDVSSQHKFDMSKTRQKFHVTSKPNFQLKTHRLNKLTLHLNKSWKSYYPNWRTQIYIVKSVTATR